MYSKFLIVGYVLCIIHETFCGWNLTCHIMVGLVSVLDMIILYCDFIREVVYR